MRRTAIHLLALPLVFALASAAGAQQQQPSRFVRQSGDVELRPVSSAMARDSLMKYTRQGQARRWSGGSLMTVAAGAIAAAYVQYGRSSRMGMSGGQTGTLAAGAIAGAIGIGRWQASRESFRLASRWSELSTASR